MHIPDGYLGPQTYLPALVVTVAMWSAGLARLRRTLRQREVPMLALSAAFCFVLMLFNVPVPGGTSGHAVGAVLVAILLGPWAAMIAVSLVLVVQALLFGDGGITALGANCLNMAIICPFLGWSVYRLIAGASPATAARRWIAAAAGGYVGLGGAAIAAGVEFGLQPLLAHDAAGHALYCPFGLSIALPAMAISHLLVFAVIEATVTGLVIAYLQRTAPALLVPEIAETPPPRALLPRLALVLGLLVLLAPLGLYLPAHFHAGSAWGEWSGDELRTVITHLTGRAEMPAGLLRAEEHGWKAPLQDYALPGQDAAPLAVLSRSYILSAALGAGLLVLLVLGARKLLARDRSAGSLAGRGAGGMRSALGSLARLLAELLAHEETARQPGLLQGLDARVKVLGMLGVLVAATLVQRLPLLALAYAGCLLLAGLSRIPARRVLRAWLVVPGFSAAVMLPALLNVVTPGKPLATLWPGVAITDAGLETVARFVLRTAVCVTLALLLAATTPLNRLLRGLRALGVPVLFIALLNMMARYLTVLVQAAEEIHLAKISRSMAAETVRQQQAWVAAGMGALFRRTQRLGDAVYLAMRARGYTGEAYLLDEPRWRPREWVFLAGAIGVAAGLVMFR